MDLDGTNTQPLREAMLTVLALTWLNPHVYLDTVVLVGSISSQYDNRLLFGNGATLASFTNYLALGYGARLLAPVFAIIALTMWAIALKLLYL